MQYLGNNFITYTSLYSKKTGYLLIDTHFNKAINILREITN